MLGVVNNFATFRDQKRHRVPDHREVFFLVDSQNFVDVQIPGFADDGDDGCLRISQSTHADVIFGSDSSPARHPESSHSGVLPVHVSGSLKELLVFGIRQRIPALDVVKTEFIELLCDQQLVLKREVDAFPLAAVSKRGVVCLNSGGHEVPSCFCLMNARRSRSARGITRPVNYLSELCFG